MNNKVIVKIIVPEIDSYYDVYLPVNQKIGDIIKLLNSAINQLSNGAFPVIENCLLFNQEDSTYYSSNVLLLDTNIRNGSQLVLLSKCV